MDRERPIGAEDHLLEQRIVPIFGRLDERAVTDLAARLWLLDAEGEGEITLLLSVSGGSVGATLALIDALDLVGVELRARCLGSLAGPPVGLLAAVGEREATPHTRLVLADDAVHLEGAAADLDRAVRHHHDQRLQLLARTAGATRGRRSLGDLIADFERGTHLSAEEACAYGLLDRVTEVNRRDPRQGRPRGIGFGPPA